ncbi:MAG: hypothetical protein IIC91_04300 [Chloroflexi bacterium]|nr:hypothetical protein [Chloroflexota bacterium]
MRFLLLAAVPIMLLADACGGGDGAEDGAVNTANLQVIERLDFEGVELEVADMFPPVLDSSYPDVVATVNGEPIMREALVFVQVSGELSRRDLIERDGVMRDQLVAQIEGSDPLESLIEEALTHQAILRLGLLPSYEEAAEFTRDQEELAKHPRGVVQPGSEERSRELFRLQGYSYADWASNVRLVEGYRMGLGINELHRQECTSYLPPPNENVLAGTDCGDFLAAERENADIEYFVVWAK